MSELIHSRPMFHSTACERCVFGRGEHAEWCKDRPPVKYFNFQYGYWVEGETEPVYKWHEVRT